MGMYNEVFKSCPKCGRRCTIQISQIASGFGGFNLDDLEDLAATLNEEQLKDLHDRVKDKAFWCVDYLGDEKWFGKGCGESFPSLNKPKEGRLKLAQELFGEKDERK